MHKTSSEKGISTQPLPRYPLTSSVTKQNCFSFVKMVEYLKCFQRTDSPCPDSATSTLSVTISNALCVLTRELIYLKEQKVYISLLIQILVIHNTECFYNHGQNHKTSRKIACQCGAQLTTPTFKHCSARR